LSNAALSPHRTLRRNHKPRKIESQIDASTASDAIAAPRLASKITPQAIKYGILDE
jgi:hypothetical protein